MPPIVLPEVGSGPPPPQPEQAAAAPSSWAPDLAAEEEEEEAAALWRLSREAGQLRSQRAGGIGSSRWARLPIAVRHNILSLVLRCAL